MPKFKAKQKVMLVLQYADNNQCNHLQKDLISTAQSNEMILLRLSYCFLFLKRKYEILEKVLTAKMLKIEKKKHIITNIIPILQYKDSASKITHAQQVVYTSAWHPAGAGGLLNDTSIMFLSSLRCCITSLLAVPIVLYYFYTKVGIT